MAFFRGPSVVTDGLVLYLDAANPDSYPGSGNTWFDISGNDNNGTLINGPTFNSGNNGSITFDGVDNYVVVSNSNSISFSQNQPNSFEYFIYLQDTNNLINGGIFSKANFSNQYAQLSFSNRINIYQELTGTTTTYSPNNFFIDSQDKWTHVVVTYDGSIIRAFKNGIIFGQSPSGKTFNANSNTLYIGCNNGTQYFLLGKISLFRIYNREVSASEIQQNYNATKSRFGLQ
jgi:hypothetical protein